MMQSLASYAMRGPLQAIVALVGLAALSLLFFPLSWPISYLGAGVVALVALTQASRESLLIVFGATAALALLAMTIGGPHYGVGYALSVWLPAWLAAQWLRQHQSLSQTLGLTGLAGLIGIGVMFLLLGDPAQWWSTYFDQRIIPDLKAAGVEFPDEAAFRELLQQVAGVMTGALLATLVLSAIVGVLIGRYWQATLFQVGSPQEFRQLRLGTLAAGIGLLIVALAQFVGGLAGQWLVNAATVVLSVFLFQGLAIGHQLAGRLPNGQPWMVALYIVLLFTLPYGAIAVAMLGMLDNWIDIRRRFPDATS
ncbi:DUF2232 domain-containing protein [Thiohalophilus thiocyanatoxydans]|uniref:Putative membrane protein DUF2232 n=1 Tax=Thiohalophilus thiocyanatoxydans TaxID=381308 RepID=A0A4V3H4B5_9GAMM|nr:DUF2232 domain-containing protein [Thiohalophilus thiocyanatoxydans]TDY02375.1 putative membrane protein DUF2232 [Thiohalophilus thiocyanatoxydans]